MMALFLYASSGWRILKQHKTLHTITKKSIAIDLNMILLLKGHRTCWDQQYFLNVLHILVAFGGGGLVSIKVEKRRSSQLACDFARWLESINLSLCLPIDRSNKQYIYISNTMTEQDDSDMLWQCFPQIGSWL